MYLAHLAISAVFSSLVNQLLDSQVWQSQSHIVMVHHLNVNCISLGQAFRLVCTVLISINYKKSLVVFYEHYTFLATKIDFSGKEVFLRHGDFHCNVLSSSAISCGWLRELRGPPEKKQQDGAQLLPPKETPAQRKRSEFWSQWQSRGAFMENSSKINIIE